MNDKLQQLKTACKGGIHVFNNEHIENNITIKDHLSELACEIGCSELGIGDDVCDMIIKTNNVTVIYLHPELPKYGILSFHRIIHYDLESAIDQAYERMKQLGKV